MDAQKERVQIKVFVNNGEHRLLRFAALSRGVTMAEFIRQSAFQAADAEIKNFVPPTLAKATPNRKKALR